MKIILFSIECEICKKIITTRSVLQKYHAGYCRKMGRRKTSAIWREKNRERVNFIARKSWAKIGSESRKKKIRDNPQFALRRKEYFRKYYIKNRERYKNDPIYTKNKKEIMRKYYLREKNESRT